MLDRDDGVRLAVRLAAGAGPTVLFLPGYRSDMGGSKASAIMDWAGRTGRAAMLMDYSGCGLSEGRFAHGSIRRWADDVLAMVRATGIDRLVLVGSSMGGWIMCHVAQALGRQVVGMVGVAAAPDFTRWGLALDADDVEALAHSGFVTRASDYGPEPYCYHRALLDDAEYSCVLDAPIAVHAPARLLHGMRDTAVPWEISLRLAGQLSGDDVRVVLVKDGDHRLSRPQDIALILDAVGEY